MRGSAPARGRVGVRCDAGRSTGVGHLVRCVALAEELADRGLEVVFLGDLGGLAFAERQLSRRGLRRLDAPTTAQALLDVVRAERMDAVVVDHYTLAPEITQTLVAADVPVLALVDGPLRGQRAHLYLDQNIGAEHDEVRLPPGSQRLAGTAYALLRDDVRRLRPVAPRRAGAGPLSVVVAFGGTDASGVTASALRAVLAADVPFRAHVVTSDPEVVAWAGALALPTGSQVVASGPFDDFPRVLAGADLVLGASGTSAWEYCCLGVPAAVAAVVDNQVQAYGRLVATGAVLPLGDLTVGGREGVDAEAVTHALTRPHVRQQAAASAHRLVDGQGRVRVADAFLALAGLPA